MRITASALLIVLHMACTCYGQVTPDDILQQARAEEARFLEEDTETIWSRNDAELFSARATTVGRLLDELAEESQSFAGHVAELMTNDHGRVIAHDDVAVATIAGWRGLSPLDSIVLQEHRRNVATCQQLAMMLIESPLESHLVDEQAKARLDEAEHWAMAQSSRMRLTRAWIDNMVESTGNGSRDLSALPTLRDAVTRHLAAWTEELSTARRRGEADARAELVVAEEVRARLAALEDAALAERIETARATAERRRREAISEAELRAFEVETRLLDTRSRGEHLDELARIEAADRAAAADRALRAETEAAKSDTVMAEAEHQALLRRARDPEVIELLRPFTAHGTWQPGDRRRGLRVTASPMSLSALQEYGALDPSDQGLFRLLSIANAEGCRGAGPRTTWQRRHVDGDRPKWGFPKNRKKLDPEHVEHARRVQALLRELGPTLVKSGDLAP